MLTYLQRDLAQWGPVTCDRALLFPVEAIPGVRVDQIDHGEFFLSAPKTVWSLFELRSVLSALDLPQAVWAPRPLDIPSDAPLSDYQRVGVRFLLEERTALLGDQMGLGKTRQAAFAAHLASPRSPVVIVGPKFLASEWKQELRRVGLSTGEDFCHLQGMTRTMDKWVEGARWFYCHYDVLQAWWSWIYAAKPGAAIVDEAHLVRNARSQRGKAIAHCISGVPYRFLLTGTPILNRVSDLWHLLHLCGSGWPFGTPSQFRIRYAGATQGEYALEDGDATRTAELQHRLGSVYLRRTAADVDLEVPPISRVPVFVDLSPSQRTRYASLFDGYPLEEVARAIMECRLGPRTIRMLGRARKLTSRAKRKQTLELIERSIEETGSCVVFSWERETAEYFQQRSGIRTKAPTHLIHGGKSQKERDKVLGMFREHGGVLCATMGSLSVGVNLQCASVVIMHDLDWTPANLLQAEARVWRQGQKRHVKSYWVLAANTLDEHLGQILLTKAEVLFSAMEDTSALDLETPLAALGTARSRVDERIDKWLAL